MMEQLTRPYADEEHDARIICGDPVAHAIAWLEAYGENINSMVHDDEDYNTDPVTIHDLIETAESCIRAKDGYPNEWIVRGGSFEGFSLDPTFWDKLAIYKGIDIPSEKRNNFFSCSC